MADNQPTPGAPAPAATPPDGVDLKSILNYDPFEQTDDAPGGKAIEPTQEPAAPGTTVDVTPPTQVPAQDEPQPPMTQEAIEAMIAERVAAGIAERFATQAPQPPAQVQPQAQPGAPQQPQRRYGFTVPQPIFDQMNSEDPAQRNNALVTIMNGMSEIIHDTVMAQVTQLVESVRAEVPQVAQQHTQQVAEQKRIFDDFYGAWPALNDPAFYAIVGQTANRLGGKHRGGWSPALRDEIGREVYKTLKWPIPGQRQNAPKPAPASSPSARPGAPTPMDEQQKEMMDLFGPS